MELIRGLHNLRPRHRGAAITIGNFDGVHLGHRAVIEQLAKRAQALDVPSLVVLFEPQPQEYLRPAAAPTRLMRLREKLLALRDCPIDRVLCVRFNERFAGLTAEQFVERILVEALGIRYAVIGDDFRFGKNRQGDFNFLAAAGKRRGFEVANTPTFDMDGERVSSTCIRKTLASGDLKAAARLLGRPYRLCGRVAHGDKIGRRIGVPTANLALHRVRPALEGIYAVEVSGLKGGPLPAAASLGTRPTVGGSRPLLELHLLDFDQDIYGAHLCVDFLHKLRDERRFDTLTDLQAQILTDIESTRHYFATRRSAPAVPHRA